MDTVQKFTKLLVGEIRGLGYEAFLVGECVRRIMSGREPCDFEIVTNIPPHELSSLTNVYTLGTSIDEGRFYVHLGGQYVLTTLYRNVVGVVSVTNPVTIEEALLCRGYTVDALAMGVDGEILDPCGGLDDLNSALLRAIGDPDVMFERSPELIVRLVGMSVAEKMGVDLDTYTGAQRCAELIKGVSPLDVSREVRRAFLSGSIMGKFFDMVDTMGISEYVADCLYRAEDVYKNTLIKMVTFDQYL